MTIPEAPVDERVGTFEEVLHAYSKEDAILEAKRCIQCRRPWCVEACPISQDAREYIRLVADGDFDGAARVTVSENPLATCLCKVCYHYCEDACVVKKKGVPVAIRHLKRAAMELGDGDLAYVASKPKHQRVAIVGAGPAGIMAAWELGIRGYGVTVFEQEPLYGGLMQTIPAYRMTDADVEEDRARLRNLDVTFVKDRKIGSESSPEHLLAEGYLAVFLSVGTSVHRTLGVEGENLPGVLPALEFLKHVNRGEGVTLGKEILVIGGGDVAMDSIRSSLRLSNGGHVSLYYRRSREEMPADPEEVHGAMAEGIEFVFQKAPLRIVGSGHAEGVVFQSIELGPPDAGGRRVPGPGTGVRGHGSLRHGHRGGRPEGGPDRIRRFARPEARHAGLARGEGARLHDRGRRRVRRRWAVGGLRDGDGDRRRDRDRCVPRRKARRSADPPARRVRRADPLAPAAGIHRADPDLSAVTVLVGNRYIAGVPA